MERWTTALLVGLLGGAGGALSVRLLLPESHTASAEAAGDVTLGTRLERIESSLRALESRAPMLEGRAVAGPEGVPAAGAMLLASAQGEAFLKAVREQMSSVLDQRIEQLRTAGGEEGRAPRPPKPGKKRVELSEAARDLQLTAQEESELRRVYAESQEKMLKLVAGPDGDVEAVRRDVDEARRDPKKAQGVMFKYMPRMLPKIGEFIQVQLEQTAAVEAAVGPERAARIESEFDLIEANPLGGGNELRVDAGMRGR